LFIFNNKSLKHMITNTIKRTGLLSVFCLLLSTAIFAQAGQPEKASPAAVASGKIGKANVTIKYSSPAVKGRTIWGDLVPYNKVWRAGANEATVFETDQPLTIQGKSLPAGKYSLYALPGENEWKIMFNSETGQWGIKRGGDSTDDPAKDVLVVTAKAKKSASFNERLLYTVGAKGFELHWADLTIPVPVK
jgi:hypothetical protein